jgi:hypothetical protein
MRRGVCGTGPSQFVPQGWLDKLSTPVVCLCRPVSAKSRRGGTS